MRVGMLQNSLRKEIEELKRERNQLVNTFEVVFEEVSKMFEDTYGTTVEVVYYSDPNEKFSCLTRTKSETYSYEIAYGYQKIARKWQLTVKTDDGGLKPLSDGSLPIRVSFISIYSDLLKEMEQIIRKDNAQIKRIIQQFQKGVENG